MTVTKRVQTVLRALPKDVTPVNLEELRRVKQLLVELECKADMLRYASTCEWAGLITYNLEVELEPRLTC